MIEREKSTVWIVEDDLLFRESLIDLIDDEERLSLEFVAGSIEEAFTGFDKQLPPDIILEDIGLPGMSGIEAIGHYKKKFPDVFIIILTIFDDDERVFEALKAGADGYLLKRTPGDQILQGIQDVLAGEILTKRETTILQHLVKGETIDEIGEALFISRHTVDTHTKNIYRKLQVHNRSTLTAKAIKERLI